VAIGVPGGEGSVVAAMLPRALVGLARPAWLMFTVGYNGKSIWTTCQMNIIRNMVAVLMMKTLPFHSNKDDMKERHLKKFCCFFINKNLHVWLRRKNGKTTKTTHTIFCSILMKS
jgi:hypothetical protein